jgi:hypothetical protein
MLIFKTHILLLLLLLFLDSSVIMIGYKVDGWGSIPGRGKRLSSSTDHEDKLYSQFGFLSNGFYKHTPG